MSSIVLITGGQREDQYLSGVQLFEDDQQAEDFCHAFNKKYSNQKYWRHAERVQESMLYEVDANDCYEGKFIYHPIEKAFDKIEF